MDLQAFLAYVIGGSVLSLTLTLAADFLWHLIADVNRA